MADTKEKMVKIVMPVGVDAGQKVSVTEAQAVAIKAQFGEYRQPRQYSAAANPAAAAEGVALRAENEALSAQVNAVQDVLTGADTPEEKLAAIAALFESGE